MRTSTGLLREPAALLAVLLAFMLAPLNTLAQTQSGTGTLIDEATIYADAQDANGGSYGNICAGNLASNSSSRRGLIRYQLPVIPAGATVNRVTLSMTQDRVRRQGAGTPKSATLRLRRAVEPWVEGTGGSNNEACGGGTNVSGVDWNSRPETAETDSAEIALPSSNSFGFTLDTDNGIENDGLIADVQAWIDGASNQGWEVSVKEENQENNARLLVPGSLTVYWSEDQPPQFTINPGLNDVWYDPATAGQGFSFTVFQESGFFFLTWYTFDTERPLEGVEAILGEPGHRWLTALGTWQGDTVTLAVEMTSGGVFNSMTPPVTQDTEYGTITIVFQDCEHATLTYDIPSLGLMGTIELVRVLSDNVAVCQALNVPPG